MNKSVVWDLFLVHGILNSIKTKLENRKTIGLSLIFNSRGYGPILYIQVYLPLFYNEACIIFYYFKAQFLQRKWKPKVSCSRVARWRAGQL